MLCDRSSTLSGLHPKPLHSCEELGDRRPSGMGPVKLLLDSSSIARCPWHEASALSSGGMVPVRLLPASDRYVRLPACASAAGMLPDSDVLDRSSCCSGDAATAAGSAPPSGLDARYATCSEECDSSQAGTPPVKLLLYSISCCSCVAPDMSGTGPLKLLLAR